MRSKEQIEGAQLALCRFSQDSNNKLTTSEQEFVSGLIGCFSWVLNDETENDIEFSDLLAGRL